MLTKEEFNSMSTFPDADGDTLKVYSREYNGRKEDSYIAIESHAGDLYIYHDLEEIERLINELMQRAVYLAEIRKNTK